MLLDECDELSELLEDVLPQRQVSTGQDGEEDRKHLVGEGGRVHRAGALDRVHDRYGESFNASGLRGSMTSQTFILATDWLITIID